MYNQTGVCTPTTLLGQVACGQPVNSSVRALVDRKLLNSVMHKLLNLKREVISLNTKDWEGVLCIARNVERS